MINRLKELREAAGLTQTDLAERLNTTGVTISRYERFPSRINLPILQELARALGVVPTQIISEDTVAEGTHSAALPRRGSEGFVFLDRALMETLGELRALMVHDVADEAMEPTLSRGALCVVDTSQTQVARDGLYLLALRGQEIVRRVLTQIDGSVRVVGDQPMYREGMVTRPEDLTVVGRVVWASSRL